MWKKRREDTSVSWIIYEATFWAAGLATSILLPPALHKCVANWRDDMGNIPLHYAAYNGRLEVVKYFITELLCDQMDRTNMVIHRFTMLVLIMVTSTSYSTSSVSYTVTIDNTRKEISVACIQTLITLKLQLVQTSNMYQMKAQRLLFVIINKTRNR